MASFIHAISASPHSYFNSFYFPTLHIMLSSSIPLRNVYFYLMMSTVLENIWTGVIVIAYVHLSWKLFNQLILYAG